MCFTQNQSGIFALIGLGLACYVKFNTSNTRLAVGVFWFFLMEFLQYWQYFWIDQCDHPVNKVLTFAGYVHICFQPYFTHIINSALTKNPKMLNQYTIILRMCLLGGFIFLLRAVLYDFLPQYQTPVSSAYTKWAGLTPAEGSFETREWLRGEALCTYKGNYHLSWSVPMLDTTYWIPGASLHSFLMFGPFFVMRKSMIIQGFFLWLTGPFLSTYFTDNLQEQASVWCFFSISQIAIMLFLIRKTLVLKWSKNGQQIKDTPYPKESSKSKKSVKAQ
ncbi:hypothetical protein PPERSA_11159 [Pseudocohnilembus persalinus]|uniref:Uncharacterized protein n=1 Tax=Pseudocohnilembus persalinus TaxID=266149 RepID=A0A0V0QZY8_PSEPJ|nr:hypothetical protein PPERSA_11159 [Pseudocohnilembus persalinus]|eukprot:KRX07610.1 hypothetical protein PPERSA_11159 [Pseudocohnilembus persalinus]